MGSLDLDHVAAVPGLEQVDGEQDHEGQQQHDAAYGRGPRIVDGREADDDEEWGGVGASGRLPAMKITEPYWPTERAKARAKPAGEPA